jgi:phosphatidylserine synthase
VAAAVALIGFAFVASGETNPGDWVTVLLVAASAGLFAAAVRARRRRSAKAVGALVLLLAAASSWFFESALIWAALGAIATAAVVSARGWGATPLPSRSAAPQ